MADVLKELTWVARAKQEARVADAAAKEMAHHCDARIEIAAKALRDALLIIGEPASGHKMMSSRREACAVHKILTAALRKLSIG